MFEMHLFADSINATVPLTYAAAKEVPFIFKNQPVDGDTATPYPGAAKSTESLWLCVEVGSPAHCSWLSVAPTEVTENT